MASAAWSRRDAGTHTAREQARQDIQAIGAHDAIVRELSADAQLAFASML